MIGVPSPAQQVTRVIRPPSNASAPPVATQAIAPMVDGVPIDFIDYFNIDMRNMDARTRQQLSDIYEIIGNDGSMGDVMTKMAEITRKVGSPSLGETRHSKIWQYLKVQSRITELEKQKRALEVIHDELPSSTA